MLRLIFVFGIVLTGAIASLQSPFYALLFYLWNAYFRPEYWVWNDLLFSLRLSLTIGVFLVLASLRHLNEFKWNRQLVLVTAFLTQATISMVVSEFVAQIWPFWLEFFKLIVVALLMTILVNTRERFRLTLWVIAWSLSLETSKQGWAQLTMNPGAVNVNSHVMLGDNNGVALGMMMLAPMLMALAQTSTTKIERYIHYFVLVGVTYRGISTYSRGGFIAAAIVFLLSLWRSQHKLKTLIATALLASTVLSVMPDRFWNRMNTISTSSEEDGRDASAQSRIYFWGIAVEMANDSPITGAGFNGFRYAFPRYDTTGDGNRATHSIWFGVLADLGYPGLLLFALIALSALWTCQQARRSALGEGDRNMVLYASHLQTAIVVYCVGGAFLSAHYLELWWHVVALAATLGLLSTQAAPTGSQLPVQPQEPITSMPVIPARLRR